MVTSRVWFTPEQKSELWNRWRKGETIPAIARALERRNKTGVYREFDLRAETDCGTGHSVLPTSARRMLVASQTCEVANRSKKT